jgi:hypothetical protein
MSLPMDSANGLLEAPRATTSSALSAQTQDSVPTASTNQHTAHSPAEQTASHHQQVELGATAWQHRLLPLMAGLLVLLTVTFLALATLQGASIRQLPEAGSHAFDSAAATISRISCGQLATSAVADAKPNAPVGDASKLECDRWKVLAQMEVTVQQRRLQQLDVTLATRMWMQLFGFVTGMMMALIGSALILGKISEAVSKFGWRGGDVGRIVLSTTSPGLLLALLGTTLMLTTLLKNPQRFETNDPAYLPQQILPTSDIPLTPPPPAPSPAPTSTDDKTGGSNSPATRLP